MTALEIYTTTENYTEWLKYEASAMSDTNYYNSINLLNSEAVSRRQRFILERLDNTYKVLYPKLSEEIHEISKNCYINKFFMSNLDMFKKWSRVHQLIDEECNRNKDFVVECEKVIKKYVGE